MAYADLPLHELRTYRPDLDVPDDLEAFWARTLDEARAHDLAAGFEPIDTGLAVLDSWDVTFAGFGGQPIRGWFHRPRYADGPLPIIVEVLGYGGGRGLPHERILWALAGYAHLVMDTRGQGAGWSVGDTADRGSPGTPQQPGVMTNGILDPATYYYRRLITDAVRAVDAAREAPGVDASRLAVVGRSQGGGIALTVAGLRDDLTAVVADVPFLCDFPRALRIADTNPYAEIVRYLKVHRDRAATVLRTLSYVDAAILGGRASAPALVSVALMDTVCPPSTVYAAINRYGGPVEVREYPYNDHESGEAFWDRERLAWVAARFGG